MTKKIIGLLLTLLLLACMPALAEEPLWSYDSGNMYLKIDGEPSGDVTIPAEVDGYPVNAIKYSTFNSNNAVTSLTMPDTLRAIQGGAISWMDGLTSVTLNDGLEYLGSIFHNCNALTSLTIPASVRIVDGAINSCASLKEITFEGVCPIFLNASWCFDGLSEDYVIYVPDDQLDAYAAALADANGAADHLQPSGKNVVIPERENNEGWFVFDAATGTITGYREYHAYIEIPSFIDGVAVKAIGEKAFRGDYSIYGIVFPEGMERIGAGAFQYASSLAYVKFPSTLKAIDDDAFLNAQIDRIDWSEGLEKIGARAFQYDHETILTLPSTVRTIGESAFEGASCQKLYLGGDMESIGSRAFAKTSLNYMAFDLYSSIDIAPDAFVETRLADLDLPWDSSIENRDAYAVLLKDQCPDCTVWINNPESGGVAEYPINELEITTIENGVWKVYNGNQANLTVWTEYDDVEVTALGDGLFKGNQSIRSFYPHHCGWFTTIGNETFADSSVEFVELFGSITTIGDEAFRNCVNITELTLPESLTSIGVGAFKGCTSITKLNLPESLTSLSDGVLEGCTGITELTLPDSLTNIGAGALKDCTGITELKIPANLTSIGSGALEGCTNLKKLVVGCDPTILPADMLHMMENIDEVYLSVNATDEQVCTLSELMGRPWYDPLLREGEERSFVEMPYEPLLGSDFWYDEEYSRLDAYQGYELNLILPREIDGVELSMVGGGMMTRATYGDNFDVELPVVSVVIPENYTEIPAYAFMNCDTLETVICYAPLEKLEEGTFSGCTSLTNVIFVNGVREIDRYVFKDCLYLETLYIGDKTQRIDENAFTDPDGYEYFTADQCITDPALMPDVDALLEEVKCDPMPEPESAPEYEPQPAQPVGAEGEPFLGEWIGASMEMEGMALSFSEMGMVMNLTFHMDGTVELYDGEESTMTSWSVVDGAAIVDGSSCVLLEDDTLCVEEDGAKLIFTRDGTPAVSTITEPEVNEPIGNEPVSDELSAYVGSWHACYLLTGGMAGDPRSDFGLDIALELNADGTGSLIFGEAEEGIWYQDESGFVYFGEGGDYDMPLVLLEGGFLCYGSMDGDGNALGGYIMFSQDPAAAWTLESESAPTSTEPTAGTDSSAEERLERKYICVNADVSGYTMDASLLGGEYSMTFHANGTMDFVMVGTLIPNLSWTQGEGAYVIDYYGTPLEATLTEEGFDLNYFDSMLMHFTAEKE